MFKQKDKREYLEAHDWKVGGVKDFLTLPDKEFEYIEIKIVLSKKLRALRTK
jgi:hypothetical protein